MRYSNSKKFTKSRSYIYQAVMNESYGPYGPRGRIISADKHAAGRYKWH